MINFQQTYTTPEQSKRLLELGVPADSADLVYLRTPDTDYDPFVITDRKPSTYQNSLPCWSVGRLIEIICNCHIITYQFVENWICCDKNTNLIELLITDIEAYKNVKHIDFSKLEDKQ